jgi:GNAT superfamily N-acetyltransferase
MERPSATSRGAVQIVPYEPEHQEQVVALVLHVQNIEYGLGISLEEQPDLLAIEAEYVGTGGGFWVAISGDGQVVGTIGVQVKAAQNGAHWGIMKKFFVQLEHRGRALDGGDSLSSRLYGALLAHAHSIGLRGILLDTPKAAERSHAFYQRVGFRPIAREDLPFDYSYPDRDSRLFQLEFTPLRS